MTAADEQLLPSVASIGTRWSAPKSELPAPMTPLIGREAEVDSVRRLLGDGARLVTLLGPGGVGKTRLAVEIARGLADAGVPATFVDLASLDAAEQVLGAIGRALGVAESPGRRLGDDLRLLLGDGERLLVLDNFEHVLAAAVLVADLLSACPPLRVLVTSRTRLRLTGEHAWEVSSLAIPAPEETTTEELARAPAVRLFVARAREIAADAPLSAKDVRAIAAICRRLDGLPLAIELAAARSGVLPPRALLKRLTESIEEGEAISRAVFPVLTGGPRDRPARQRSLGATLAWSHDLLTAEERVLFRHLAVFVGGFSLEAAEWLSPDGGGQTGSSQVPAPPTTLDLIESLADKSLLRRRASPDGGIRFSMLETVRDFAGERLTASGDEEECRRAHACFFLDFAERLDGPIYEFARPLDIDRVDAEHPNLRAALSWSLATEEVEIALRLAGALFTFWFHRAHFAEGQRWLERALALAPPTVPADLRARALVGIGVLAMFGWNLPRAGAAIAEALAMASVADNPRLLGMTHAAAALLAAFEHRPAEVRGHGSAAERLAAETGDIGTAYRARFFMARADQQDGDYDGAAAHYQAALTLAQAGGGWQHEGILLMTMAQLDQIRGDRIGATRRYAEALRGFRETGELWSTVVCMEGVATLGANTAPSAAARLFGAAAALRESVWGSHFPDDRPSYEQARAVATRRLGCAEFDAAVRAGGALPLPAAFDEALALAETLVLGNRTDADAILTPRQREVLGLLAEGRADKEIAAALGLSRHTASKHVAAILAKFDAPSRSAAVAAARRAGLV